MLHPETCKKIRKECDCRNRRALDLKDTFNSVAAVIERVESLGSRIDHLDCIFIELGALRGHFHSTALAVQELDSEFLLKIAYMCADRGLGEESRVCGLAEALVSYYVYESFYLFEIH